MNNEFIEITSYQGQGYQPMIDYETWRVAILRYCKELELDSIKTMQKHMETDEVFVLLEGNCMLFTGGNCNSIDTLEAIAMKPLQLYNIKRGVWHTHTLDHSGTVLIIENRNTSNTNSPTEHLSEIQRNQLYKLYKLG